MKMRAQEIQIYREYTGENPAVRNFFFGAGFKGEMKNDDSAVLAVKGGYGIVGGVLVRKKEVLCLEADNKDIRKKLLEAIQAKN